MSPLAEFYVSFAGGVFIFLVIVLFGERKRYQAYRRFLLPLAQIMSGEVPRSLLFGRYLKLDIQGFEGRVLLTPQGDAPMMILVLYAPLDFWLIIKWSNAGTRTVSKHFAPSSITTGDPAFDAKYVINAGDKMRAQAHLMEHDKRAAMDWLMSHGYWRFAGNKRKVTVTMVGYAKEHLEPEHIRESFRQMLIVAGKRR